MSFALAALAALLTASAGAADVVVLAPSPLSRPYSEAFQGVCDELAACPPVLGPRDAVPADARVVVAFGGRAARRRIPSRAVLITALTPGYEARRGDGGGPVVRVLLTFSPSEFVRRLTRLRPEARRTVILYASPASGRYAAEVRGASRAAGLDAAPVEVSEPEVLPAVLRSLPSCDALWLAPDPDLVTPAVFDAVKEYAQARGIAFFSPAPELAARGAEVGLSPGFRAAGRRAGRAAREALASAPAGDVAYPEEDLPAPPPSPLVSTRSASDPTR